MGEGYIMPHPLCTKRVKNYIIIYFDLSPCNAGRCFISMQNPATAGGSSYLLRQSLLIIRFWQEERKVGRYNGKEENSEGNMKK